ncbi:MAG: PKD domain-containing protein [Bacteroidia bacterium]|nr:PKD domain-containing protein [Bacteroidia bacterium]
MQLKFTFYFLVLSVLWVKPLHAQLVMADTLPNDTLFSTLFSQGVTVSNLSFQFCQPSQTGQFNGVNSNLGLDSGVVISTGNVLTAGGANISALTTGSFSFLPQNYPPLTGIGGGPVYDVCVIEFDIVPLCDSIGISYVFASEEYNEFVASSFNDVFAFYISGPGYTGTPGQNIARIPGTTIPVAINNVNNGNSAPGTIPFGPCTNCPYYTDNTFGTSVEFDGFTIPMVAAAAVIPCQTYHITLAIADVFDASYDSGVFFEVGGIGCITPTLNLSATNSTVLGANVAVEGCVNYGLFTFTLPTPPTDTTVFYFTVGGSATPGTDYQTLPDSIVMPAGVDSVVLPVYIFSDNLAEGTEFIEIYYVDSTLCTTTIYRDTAVMQIWDKPIIPPLQDTAFCSSDVVTIGYSPQQSQTYQWTPATGLSSTTISNPNLSLTFSGITEQKSTYYLLSTDVQGYCIYEDSLEVTVYPGNFAEFSADSICEGYRTSFTSTTGFDQLTAWAWQFGDGQTSTTANPLHLYANQGTYQTQLITTNSKGCVDTIVHAVLVDSLPVVSFTVDPVCQNTPSLFVNDVRPGVNYAWDFGDGGVSNGLNPVHIYTGFGFFPVQLVATTARGCVDSLTRDAEVYKNPVAEFAAEFECFGTPTQFTNQTQLGTGTSLFVQWTFGDGGNSLLPNPTHLYGSYGTYNATLQVTDNLGCRDNHSENVRVYALPDADFTAEQICEENHMIYTNQSTAVDNSLINRFFWSFHDGRTSGVSDPEPFYWDPGIFQTQLKILTEFGCADSITKSVVVYPHPVVAYNMEPVCVFDSSHFLNQSWVDSTVTGDKIVSWTWDLGDGTLSNSVLHPVHVYQTAGFFPITLSVATNNGCTSSRTLELEIYPLPPAPDLQPDTVCFSDQAFLIAQAVPPTKRVEWFYGINDQQPFQEGNSYVTPPLPYPQTYYARAISDHECIGEKYPLEAMLYQPGQAEIIPSEWVAEIPNSLINFRISGNIEVEEYRWNFGDGTHSLEAEPSHEYRLPGKYEVIVDLVDRYGCEYRYESLIEIKQIIGVHIPSAFSPNSDGFNDELLIGHHLIATIDFQVFNRWGERVYVTNELDFRWDGQGLRGQTLPEGVYVFHLEARDIHGNEILKSGTITLVR